MDDFVQFLRDRLDEDEQIARRATARAPGGEVWVYENSDVRAASGLTVARRSVPVLGDHIARHDPARVLADVEAKRAILDFVETRDGEFHRFTLLDPLAGVWRDHPDFDPSWLED